MISNIQNIKSGKIKIFPLQTRDVFMVLWHDLPTAYLMTLLIDKLGFHITQFSIEYVYSFKNYPEILFSKLKDFNEDYFIFFLEDFYHSSDYAYDFLVKVLDFMNKNKINKKIIVHTIKTPTKEILFLFEKSKNVLLVINTDVEYFFNEFFYKKTPIEEICNIHYRDDELNIFSTKTENVECDL
jgi:hypothetical protein